MCALHVEPLSPSFKIRKGSGSAVNIAIIARDSGQKWGKGERESKRALCLSPTKTASPPPPLPQGDTVERERGRECKLWPGQPGMR